MRVYSIFEIKLNEPRTCVFCKNKRNITYETMFMWHTFNHLKWAIVKYNLVLKPSSPSTTEHVQLTLIGRYNVLPCLRENYRSKF